MHKFLFWVVILLGIVGALAGGVLIIMTNLAPPWPERLGVRMKPARTPITSMEQVSTTNGFHVMHHHLMSHLEPSIPYDLYVERNRYLKSGGNLSAVTNRFADDVVAVMEPLVEALEKSAAQPDYQNLLDLSGVDPMLDPAVRLSGLMPAYVDILAARNEKQKAIRATDLLTTWGESYSRGGFLISYLVSEVIRRKANDCRAILAEKHAMKPATIRRWMQELQNQPGRVQSLPETIRYELLFIESRLSDVFKTNDIKALKKYFSAGNPSGYRKWVMHVFRLTGSSEKRTTRHLYDYYSHLIGRMEDPALGATRSFIDAFAENQSPPWLYIDDPIGKHAVLMTAPTMPLPGSEHLSARGTRLMLAVRLYEQETGMLPDRLEALVPNYMDAIPTDPFDPAGGTFLYVNGIVYSRFKNEMDDGATHAYEENSVVDGDATFAVDLYRHRLEYYKP